MPAFENISNTLPGIEAGADLSALQFIGVQLNADEEAIAPAGQGQTIVGVLQNKPQEGEAASLAIVGSVTKILAASAFDPGDLLTVAANGKFEEAATGDYIAGVAVTGVANADEIGTMVIIAPGRVA